MNDNFRIYRSLSTGSWERVQACHKDSDIVVHYLANVDRDVIGKELLQQIVSLRESLESYSDFVSLRSLLPVDVKIGDTEDIVELKKCSQQAGVGPLAGIAGFFAKKVGEFLLQKFNLGKILVENGGDLYLFADEETKVLLPAGDENSRDLSITIDEFPMGVATSSGKSGPSFSKGRADSVCVVARNAVLADCFATAYANRLKSAEDLQVVLEGLDPDVFGFIACIDGQYAIKSKFAVEFC